MLLKHIVGLALPDRGQIRIDGESVSDADASRLAALRRRMGYVFQDAALLDWLDVQDNVRLGLGDEPGRPPTPEVARRVREALDRVNLPPSVLGKRPTELSGGMRKRAGVARAIVNTPDIVLYDEPTTGLDPRNVSAINDVVLRVRDELRATSIVVTHDMASVRAVADRVVLLSDGRIRFHGATHDFFETSDALVLEFIGAGSPPSRRQKWPATPVAATS